MFCPECQAEYRAGFTRCADCDVNLVNSIQEIPNDKSDSLVAHESDDIGTGPEGDAETAEQPDPNADAYCPLCLAGYRAGFTACSDCHVELVGSFEEARTSRSRLWRGSQESELDRILAALDAENIVSHYKELVNVGGRALVMGIPIGARKPTFEYEVWVFRKDLERAKEAIAEAD